jgi:hypothetical protein
VLVCKGGLHLPDSVLERMKCALGGACFLQILYATAGMVMDANGNVFFTLMTQNIVLKLDSNGVVTLAVGKRHCGLQRRRRSGE